MGIPLRTIKGSLAALPDNRTPTSADWSRLSRSWRQDLDDRIRRLHDLRDQLDSCIGCGCLSIDRCRLYNPNDIRGGEGPGARKLA